MNRRDFLAKSSVLALSSPLAAKGLGAPATKPQNAAEPAKFMRGVSLYSYQEEYYQHLVTLEDCLAELASIGASGVQMIAEEMVPNYPDPPQEWVENWHALLFKYHLTPTNLDTFVDINVGGHRNLTVEESSKILIGQVRLANRLGFKVVRPTTGPVEEPAVDMVERALQVAAQLDVRIAPEIHAPISLDGRYIDSYLELIHRTGSKHMGFTMDCGIFCKKLPRVMIDYWLRHGTEQRVADYVQKAYSDGVNREAIVAGVQKINPTDPNMSLALFAGGYGPVTNTPAQLKAMAPFIYNIHGKFYEMTDDLTEFSIPYDEIIPALTKLGYAKSIDSEYEGQRWTQDIIETDSFEQVRREHVMFRRLTGDLS